MDMLFLVYPTAIYLHDIRATFSPAFVQYSPSDNVTHTFNPSDNLAPTELTQ
jgi:hypothetical protein